MGYTKEQLRIAFRHGCWLGIAAMDEDVGPDDVTDAVIQSMNEWFDDWFLQTGFTTAGTAKDAKDGENPEQEEDKS